jgi:hypothetical protein
LNQVIIANPIITVFLRPYPIAEPEKYAQYSLYDKLTYIPTGIFATYLAFVTLSDAQGQLTFLRKHPAPKISPLVTDCLG